MFENKELLEDVFLADEHGENYIIFEHRQKTWILPAKSMYNGLEMYQPATCKGKILKFLLAKFATIGLLREFTKTAKVQLSLNGDIEKYISDNIETKEQYFVAGYMGDVSSEDNNKVTLQIYDNNKIIAYIKVTKSENTAKLFHKETQTLKLLKDKEIDGIPKIISEKEINGMNMFIQDTKKDIREKVKFVFDKRHIEFLKTLVEKNKTIEPYESTDFYSNVEHIKKQKDKYKNSETLKKAIEIIESKLQEKEMEYAFSHGDYTPWNVYYTNKQLQVFDFEYCSFSKPCYIDIFHYLTQMSLLGYGNNGSQTISLYEKEKPLLEKYMDNPDFTYLCYLIDIIGFYGKRTERKNDVVDNEYGHWIFIMEYLISKLENTVS